MRLYNKSTLPSSQGKEKKNFKTFSARNTKFYQKKCKFVSRAIVSTKHNYTLGALEVLYTAASTGF